MPDKIAEGAVVTVGFQRDDRRVDIECTVVGVDPHVVELTGAGSCAVPPVDTMVELVHAERRYRATVQHTADDTFGILRPLGLTADE